MEYPLFFWDWRMVAHLYIGGLAIGGYLFGVLLYHLNADRYQLVVTRLLIAGPIGAIVAFGFLWLSLKEGGTGLMAYLNAHPRSDLAIGLMLQAGFVALGIWLLGRLRSGYETLPPPMLIVTALVGLAALFFHGALLLWTGLPFWSDALFGVMPLSALAAGFLGGWLLVRKPFGSLPIADKQTYTVNLPLMGALMLAALGLLVFFWMLALAGGDGVGQLALLYLMEERTFWLFGVFYGAGIFLPLAILANLSLKKTREPGRIVTWICGGSVLVGTLVLKTLIVYLAKGL